MFSGSNSGPNLTNTVEITAAYIYLAPKNGGKPKELNELFVSDAEIKDKFFRQKQKLMGKQAQKLTKDMLMQLFC